MRSIAAGFLLACCLAACLGCGAARPEPSAVSADGLVIILIVPQPERLPFDPRGARLRAATAELGRIAGHPITFVIDAGLALDTRSSFDGQLIEAVETVARDLAGLRERDAAAFTYAVPFLAKITCRYRAVARRAEGALDEPSRTLAIDEPGHSYDGLVPRGLVFGALLDAYSTHADARYASIAPRDVPPAERRAYFRYLASSWSGNGKMTHDEGPISERRAGLMIKMVDLAGLVGRSDATLAADLHLWILREKSFFYDAYVHAGDAAQGAAPAFHAAERAWVGWLVRSLPTMNAADRLAVARTVFVSGFNDKGYLPFAFPGFDKMGFALDIVGEWMAAGHPDTFASRAPTDPLFEYIVCPHPKNENGDRSMGPRCEHDMYRLAADDEVAGKRLVDTITSRNDPIFTELAFAALRYAGRGDTLTRMLAFWRKVEGHEPSWTIAARVIAEELAGTSDRTRLLDEVRRLWAKYPSRRGPLLYVLAEADPYDNGAIDWKGFAHDFGAPIQRAELAGMLDQNAHALARVPTLWPALGAGWSRAQVIVPRLDAWLDGPPRGRNPQGPFTTLHAIFHRMCAEGGTEDLLQMHLYLVERTRRHPGDAINALADDASPDGCGTNKPRAGARK